MTHDFEHTGFRETMLYLFTSEDAAALRHAGKLLHTLGLEAGRLGSERKSLTRREMEAGLTELVHVRDFFWSVGRDPDVGKLSPEDARLTVFAQELMTALDGIITLFQEVLE